MSTGVKIAVIVGSVLLTVIVIGGVVFWQMTKMPLYKPGMVRSRAAETPVVPAAAQPESSEWWAVEEGIELWHFAEGSGRNVLVVHGGPGYPYREAWSGLDGLTGSYTFHYYDQRGCGNSTRPIDTLSGSNTYQNMQTLEQTLGLSAQIADIERIRQILGEEKLILIGHSFGGFTAALYAAEFPERVEALVLVSPADMLLMPPSSGGLFEAVQERLPAEMQADYDAYLKEYLNFQGLMEKDEASLAALNDELAMYYSTAFDLPGADQGEVGGWMVQAQYLSMGQRHDYRDALAQVEAPVLILHSENDIQPQSVAQMYVDALPGAQMGVITGAGHNPFEEQPEQFAAVVGQFLGDLP